MSDQSGLRVDSLSDTRKPSAIETASLLLWGSLATGAVIAGLDSAQLLATPSVIGWAIGITLAIFALMAVLIHHIGLGRNWARMTLLVLFVLGTVPYLPNLQALFSRSNLLGGLSLVQLGMQLAALYLVFTGAGAGWFRRNRQ